MIVHFPGVSCNENVRVIYAMCYYLMKMSSSFSTKLYSKLLMPLKVALTTVLQWQKGERRRDGSTV